MNIKVSVVIPVYNASKYLKQALDSVIGQTLEDIEIICVDDGSTDDSYNILLEYEKIDDRIKVLKHLKDSKGAAEARNMGLDNARGEYVSFLDADDFFEADMLEKAYDRAKETGAQIVMFDGWAYDSVNKVDYRVDWILNRSNIPAEKIFSSSDNRGKLFIMNSGSAWSSLYCRDFLNDNGIRFFAVHPDDQVFVYLAFSLAQKITWIPDKLVHYRKNNAESQVEKNIVKNPEAGYEASVTLFRELKKRGVLEEHKASLANMAVINATVYLNFMKTQDSFEWLFNKLKNEIFDELQISGTDSKIFVYPELDKKRKWILNCTPEQYLINQNHIKESDFEFGFIMSLMKSDSRVAIYGAGNYGKRFFNELSGAGSFRIAGWADKNALELGYPLITPEELMERSFDYVVVAIVNSEIYMSVKNWMVGCGISEEKILWIANAEERRA